MGHKRRGRGGRYQRTQLRKSNCEKVDKHPSKPEHVMCVLKHQHQDGKCTAEVAKVDDKVVHVFLAISDAVERMKHEPRLGIMCELAKRHAETCLPLELSATDNLLPALNILNIMCGCMGENCCNVNADENVSNRVKSGCTCCCNK
jgi:hypothetical protein